MKTKLERIEFYKTGIEDVDFLFWKMREIQNRLEIIKKTASTNSDKSLLFEFHKTLELLYDATPRLAYRRGMLLGELQKFTNLCEDD